MCWLALENAESTYFAVLKNGARLNRVEYYEHRVDRAQTRYLSAVKALAQVRRLQRPDRVQVNIGANQANVAEVSDRDLRLASRPVREQVRGGDGNRLGDKPIDIPGP
jgi:hypothetical protein